MCNVAVIDIDSLIFAMFHPNKVVDAKGVPLKENGKFIYQEKTEDEVISSCDFMMNLVLTNSNADSYIGVVKGSNTIKNKLLIDPTYKQDRDKESPKYWNLCKDHLVRKWNVIEADDYEADEYVNVIRLAVNGAYIVAIDGDLLGLETNDKFHYNWKKNEWIEVSESAARYKFWCDMICGTHNNTKGVPGKGIKYCEKIFLPDSDNKTDAAYAMIVINEFIDCFKDDGVDQFYKNYKMNKIPSKIEGFIIPEPIKYIREDTVMENEVKHNF